MKNSVSLFLLALPFASFAQFFDFENAPATYTGSGARPGAITSLSMSSEGLTMTVTRSGGIGFDVYGFNNDATFGNRWIDGFNVTNTNRPFIMDFSQPLSNFSIWAGQFTASAPRTATLRAYSGEHGTGSMLAMHTGEIPIVTPGLNSNWTGVNLAVAAGSFRSVTLEITGSFFNGFADHGRATVAAVPEPGTFAALAMGAIVMFRRRIK